MPPGVSETIARVVAADAFGGVALMWLVMAIGTGLIAGEKKRRFWPWLALGVVMGPFALLWSALASRAIPPERARPCPHCAGTIDQDDATCPHCRRRVAPAQPDAAARLGREAAGAVFLLRRAMKGGRGLPRPAPKKAEPK